MGVLTEDMTRLGRDIVVMRQARKTLHAALMQGNSSRKNTVSQLCAGFGRARTGMARHAHTLRHSFLNSLKQEVRQHRQAMRADLVGVRRAWVERT